MAAAFFRLSGLVLNLKNGTFRYQVTQIWLKNHNYTFEDLEKNRLIGIGIVFFSYNKSNKGNILMLMEGLQRCLNGITMPFTHF